jgi:hypothetical protein
MFETLQGDSALTALKKETANSDQSAPCRIFTSTVVRRFTSGNVTDCGLDDRRIGNGKRF